MMKPEADIDISYSPITMSIAPRVTGDSPLQSWHCSNH